MTRNFHRWEVDPFFTAAEEVQDSTDRLELAYRTWVHAKSVDVGLDESVTLEHRRRELSTALGTAKWQLEEFERAVSYLDADEEGGAVDDTPARHQQFVHALQSQIDLIEKSVLSSGDSRDLKGLSVVRLGQEDKDDLTLFLCGSKADLHEDSKKRVSHSDEEITSESASSNEVSECFSTSASNSEKSSSKADSKRSDFFRRPVETGYLNKSSKHTSSSEVCIVQDREPVSEPFACMHPSGCETSARVWNGHFVSGSSGSSFSFWKSGSADAERLKNRPMTGATIASKIWPAFFKKIGVFHKKGSKSGLKRWKDGDDNPTDHSSILKFMHEDTDLEKGNESTYIGGAYNCSNSKAPGCVSGNNILCSKRWGEVSKMLLYYMHAFSRSRFVHKASTILVATGFAGLIFFLVTSSAL